MSEFSKDDVKNWVSLMLEKRCSLYQAIQYCLFWYTMMDPGVLNRAYEYAVKEINEAFES